MMGTRAGDGKRRPGQSGESSADRTAKSIGTHGTAADAVPVPNDRGFVTCRYCAQGSADRPAEWSQTPHQPGGCLSGMHRAHLDKVRAMNGEPQVPECTICNKPIWWTFSRTTHLVCEAKQQLGTIQ